MNSSFVLTSENFFFLRMTFPEPGFFGNPFRRETSETEDMVFSRAFICFWFLSVCTAIASAQFPTGNPMVRWRTVASGSSSTETQQKLRLASAKFELENVWGPILKQNRAMPLVDFSKDRLVIVFIGTRNTGGYSALCREVIGGGGSTATVCVDDYYPGPTEKVSQGITSPWVMIAIDRAYLDINAKIQKVEANRLPSISLNPLTTFIPMPWNPCGYGIGGSWVDPVGFGFDSFNEFQGWCQQNQFGYPSEFGNIDFSVNRLVLVSAGDFGLGFGIQIGDVFMNSGETIIQVQRTNVQISPSQRSYLLLAMGRQTKKYSVEYLVSAQDCYLDSGPVLPFRTRGAWVATGAKDLSSLSAADGSQLPQPLVGFDYTKANLGIVFLGELQPHVNYSVDRVAYRGSTAVVYIKKSVVVSGLANPTYPYFAFRFDKKVRNIKVVDMTN